MQHEIITRLKAIRHRQEKRLVVASLARGLLAGSIVALTFAGMAAATLWLPLPAVPGRFWVLVVLSCLAGVAVVAGVVLGVARRPRLPAGLAPVAALVDAQCRLQDRLRTALEFLEKADASRSRSCRSPRRPAIFGGSIRPRFLRPHRTGRC